MKMDKLVYYVVLYAVRSIFFMEVLISLPHNAMLNSTYGKYFINIMDAHRV